MPDALHLPDRVLVDRLLAGDTEAADLFVTRFTRLVWAILARDFRVPEDVREDIFQDLFEALWDDDYRRLRQWAREGDFAAYLCPIVRRRAIDHIRQQHPDRVRALPEPDADDDLTDGGPGPEELAWLEEQRAKVEQALEDCSPEDREIYRMRFAEERSYAEIAHELDMTVNNVGVRINRLTEKLRAGIESAKLPVRLANNRKTRKAQSE